MSDRGAKKPGSMMLRTHCQTSGVSLTEQDPYNNVVRTAYEALAAVLGGTQSLHTNSFDEAIALPDRVLGAHRPQHAAHPRRGDRRHRTWSIRSAARTTSRRSPQSLADAAWKLIEEVDGLGGMTKAVESGMPKLRIEEAAARRQAAVDRGEETIVGVNKYRLADESHDRRARDRQHRGPAPAARAARAGEGRARSRSGSRAALDALTNGAARRRQPARAVGRGDARPGDGRGDLRRDGAGVRPPPRRDPLDLRRVRRRVRRRRGVRSASARRSTSSRRQKAGGRASSSPSSARTATTAAPR